MKEGAVKLDSARPKTVIIVVPVVLIVVPPAIIIKRREVALRGRAAVVAVRAEVAETRRSGIIACEGDAFAQAFAHAQPNNTTPPRAIPTQRRRQRRNGKARRPRRGDRVESKVNRDAGSNSSHH